MCLQPSPCALERFVNRAASLTFCKLIRGNRMLWCKDIVSWSKKYSAFCRTQQKQQYTMIHQTVALFPLPVGQHSPWAFRHLYCSHIHSLFPDILTLRAEQFLSSLDSTYLGKMLLFLQGSYGWIKSCNHWWKAIIDQLKFDFFGCIALKFLEISI